MATSFKRSLRVKLILLITGMASFSVLVACMSLLVYEFVHYRQTLLAEELTMAQLVEDSSAPALLFSDAAAANETLSMLRTDPRITLACLYDKRGKKIAGFHAPGENASCPDTTIATSSAEFTRSVLLIERPIRLQNDTVGSLSLQVSLREMTGLLLHFAQVGGCVLVLTTTLALLLAMLLERLISRPILHLTHVANEVSSQHDYTLRATRFSEDETGVLIDQFNAMMEQIEERENALQEARNSLEEKVRVRTQDLIDEIAERKIVERDLETARVAAEDSNRAKSAFLSNMSHELRTPLNAIIGYSEMLQEDAKAEGNQEREGDLNKVLVSARHLLRLIGEILDLSKIEAGQMKLLLEPVCVEDVLRDVQPTAEMLAKKNRNQIMLSREGGEPEMHADALRLRQCLLNLVSNACKFTEDGIITLAVTTCCKSGENWVCWSVEDNGIGITREAQEKLFRSFYQVDGSNTRKYGGTGLGLAISQQLCRAMGGRIEVLSEPGCGSKFTMFLPAVLSEAVADGQSMEASMA
jgi:signal transduction histidine kinase